MNALAADSEFKGSGFAAKRDAIFSDIDTHLRKVTNLKTHLNTLTHIGQIPNEVLSEILVAYARDCYRAAAHDRSWLATSPSWINLAHVCRHWREVAFETPRFWSYIDVKKPKAFLALIPRSKSSPLYIDLTMDQHNWGSAGLCTLATELIGQQSQRLRELRFGAKSKQFRTLAGVLSQPWPLLETLVLSDRGGEDVPDDSHLFLVFPTAERVPRLRHLELHRLAFIWTDPVSCPTLTTLILVGKASWGDKSPTGTFGQFIDALKAMAPTLVNLTLDEAVPRLRSHTIPPPPTHGPSISFPSLQTLRILCHVNDCVHLMDHLSVNPAATMDLTENSGTDLGVERLVEIVSAHMSRSTPLLALRISSLHPTSGVSIRGYKDADLGRVGFDDLGDINLTFGTRQPGERPLAAALKGAGSMFSRVRNLSFVTENGTNVPWSSLFACTPSVVTLEVVGNPGSGFVEALSDVHDVQNGESSAMSGPLLRLRKLRLDNVHFRYWGRASWYRDGGFFDGLRDWVILRCNYGIPLDRLEVWQCKYAVAKDVRRLREIVVQVDWDRWERESDEDEDEDEDGDDDEDFYAHQNYHAWY